MAHRINCRGEAYRFTAFHSLPLFLLFVSVDVACDTDELSTLCELISGSELTVEALSNEVFTVFAPTNEAWASLDVEVFSDLVNCTSSLNSVFAFHTIYGSEVYSTDLQCTERITMSNGDDSRTVCAGNKVYQKGSLNPRDQMPEIVMADIEACNGVIHMVSEVMLPNPKYVADCSADATPARNPIPTRDVSTEVDAAPAINIDIASNETECKTVGKFDSNKRVVYWEKRLKYSTGNYRFAFANTTSHQVEFWYSFFIHFV